MNLTFHAHSCVSIETASASLIIDPFLTGNPLATVEARDIRCDYILITHGHEDHTGDALALAEANDAMIIANYEIAEYYAAKGAKSHGLAPGGAHPFPFGRVKFTPALHSSSFNVGLNPIYMGVPCGIVIEADDQRIYHAGDTGLFTDMQLIARGGLDVAFIPIGDNYTMGPEDALDALDWLKPGLTVPIHYNTFPLIEQDAERFAADAAGRGHEVRVLQPGERLSI